MYMLQTTNAVADAIRAQTPGVVVHPELVDLEATLLERIGRRLAAGTRARFNLPGESDHVRALCELNARGLIAYNVDLYPGGRLAIDARLTGKGLTMLEATGALYAQEPLNADDELVLVVDLGEWTRCAEVLAYAQRRGVDIEAAVNELVNAALSQADL